MKASCYLLLAFMFTLPTAACRTVSGLVNGVGRVLDGSAFAEKTIKIYGSADKNISFRLVSTKDGESQVVFALNRLPFIRFYGAAPDETGHFFITRAHFFYSSIDGWLEGDVDASGSGRIVETGSPSGGQTAEFSLRGPVTLTGITRGAIKRHGLRLYGERALTELRNRQQRIQLVTDWMRELSPPVLLEDLNHFVSYWQSILLPETASKKMRPFGFDAAQKGEYSYGEEVKWSTAYTRELFPEHLRYLRDSGSLLRDWEEAYAWFYTKYYWDIIVMELNRKHCLNM